MAEYEAPAFIADKAATRNGTASEAYFTPALTSSNAVYAIWIGTNDVGNGAFLTVSTSSASVPPKKGPGGPPTVIHRLLNNEQC